MFTFAISLIRLHHVIFQFDGAAGERLCHASSVFASNQAKADRLFKVNSYITT